MFHYCQQILDLVLGKFLSFSFKLGMCREKFPVEHQTSTVTQGRVSVISHDAVMHVTS